MTWSDIGVLAELLGAIGVIASLIYLSRQVRQNTRAVRMANAAAGQNNFSNWRASSMRTGRAVR
jgi:hypothetical protein